MRRAQGSGSIYQRKRDGLWVACVSLGAGSSDQPRRRKYVTSMSREALLEKLDRIGMHEHFDTPPSRGDYMTAARAFGTHTEAEWSAKCRALNPRACRHCGVPLNAFNIVKDHVVPVARGGSDAIENLEPICWQCNAEKSDSLESEWHYDGPVPREFQPHPLRRKGWIEARAAVARVRGNV